MVEFGLKAKLIVVNFLSSSAAGLSPDFVLFLFELEVDFMLLLKAGIVFAVVKLAEFEFETGFAELQFAETEFEFSVFE